MRPKCQVAPLFSGRSRCAKMSCKAEPANELRLDGSERALFDSIATDLNRHAGTPIEYFKQVIKSRDPVTSEPLERGWRKFDMYANFERPTGSPEMREEGFRITWSGTVWITRLEFERAGCPPPEEADVIRAWDVPFFASFGTAYEDVPKAGYYFDIVDVEDDGHINDSAAFVQFQMEIRRRTELTPERRLFGES